MISEAKSVQDYLDAIPTDRKVAFNTLRETILRNIPSGFREEVSYGMIGFVVPHDLYPPGYHTDPKLPLPFAYIASQKHFIALYHMGLYADDALLMWFKDEYAQFTSRKLDMGKSCVRFKKMDQIPFDLIAELMKKMSVQNWIDMYEKRYKK
jgi:uncharacterized protein YdhG (YjbR/CyaY superfamily)